MNVEHGGRITLRQSASEDDRIEYQGELSTGTDSFRVGVSVALSDGAVAFRAEGPEAPAWLLEIARTTLRSAWHAYRAGTAWPRRLTRWRTEPESESS